MATRLRVSRPSDDPSDARPPAGRYEADLRHFVEETIAKKHARLMGLSEADDQAAVRTLEAKKAAREAAEEAAAAAAAAAAAGLGGGEAPMDVTAATEAAARQGAASALEQPSARRTGARKGRRVVDDDDEDEDGSAGGAASPVKMEVEPTDTAATGAAAASAAAAARGAASSGALKFDLEDTEGGAEGGAEGGDRRDGVMTRRQRDLQRLSREQMEGFFSTCLHKYADATRAERHCASKPWLWKPRLWKPRLWKHVQGPRLSLPCSLIAM